MFASVMRLVDLPLLLGPTKTLIYSSNSNLTSSKGPILVTRKSRIGIARSPGIASPQPHNLLTSDSAGSVAHFSLAHCRQRRQPKTHSPCLWLWGLAKGL